METSIVVPVHGECSFLVSALNSIRNQEQANLIFECIVILDRASENTVKVLHEYIRTSKLTFRVIASKEPGIVAALNLGVNSAQCELIARLDADDLMMPNRISLQVSEFSNNPNLVLCGAQLETIDSQDLHLGFRNYPQTDSHIRKTLNSYSPFAHPVVMFRKSAFLKTGGYRKFYQGAEDYDLWCRLSLHGEMCNIPEPLLKYRVHPGQVSTLFKFNQLMAERAVKISHREAKQGRIDLSERYEELEDWIEIQKKSFFWKATHFSIKLRMNYYSANNRITRLAVAILLLALNPALTFHMVKQKYFKIIHN